MVGCCGWPPTSQQSVCSLLKHAGVLQSDLSAGDIRLDTAVPFKVQNDHWCTTYANPPVRPRQGRCATVVQQLWHAGCWKAETVGFRRNCCSVGAAVAAEPPSPATPVGPPLAAATHCGVAGEHVSAEREIATVVLPKISHCNSSKSVPNRPLRGRRGRFGTLLQQLECGIFGRTAVARPGRAEAFTLQPFSKNSALHLLRKSSKSASLTRVVM